MNKDDFKNLRKKSGLTQAQIGELAGISPGLVSGIESGKENFTDKVAARVNALFYTNKQELVFKILEKKTVQVQVDGSTVGLLTVEFTGEWLFEPDGMAGRYGKGIEKTFKKISDFKKWWSQS